MKKIGIVGSRSRDSHYDFNLCLTAFLSVFEKGDKIVSGGCPKGGDSFAEIIAINERNPEHKVGTLMMMGISERKILLDGNELIEIFYADWEGLGKRAGFVRNSLIAEACDVLIAVVSSDRSGGTEDTIRKVTKLGRKVIIV